MNKYYDELKSDKYHVKFKVLDNCVWIHNIFVEKEHRNQGIARNLIYYFIRTYKKDVSLECWPTLVPFYEKLGFKVDCDTNIGYKEMTLSYEYILCSAVWYKEYPLQKNDIHKSVIYPKNIESGAVFCGFRHNHCILHACAISGKKDHELGRGIQGFLTSNNRFVDREEGRLIAYITGQTEKKEGQLFSEDLY